MDAYNVINNVDLKEKIDNSISEIIRENFGRFKQGFRSSYDGSWTSLTNTEEPSQIWEKHSFIFDSMSSAIEYCITEGCNSVAREIVWEWFHTEVFNKNLKAQLKNRFVSEMKAMIEKEGKYPSQEE